MSIDHDIAILERVPMLRVLGYATLRMIAVGAETRNLMTGEMLFAPGQRPDCAYVVQRGAFRIVTDSDAQGYEGFAQIGDIIAEFALLNEETQPLNAIAQGYSTVMRISRSMFLKILEDDVQSALRLRDYIARRAQQTITDMLTVRSALGGTREE